MSLRNRHAAAHAAAIPGGRVDLYPVRVMGEAVTGALSSCARWRVLAVFERSIYVQNRMGGLICLGPGRFAAGPLNALCDVPEPIDWVSRGIGSGSAVVYDGGVLTVGARIRFSFTRARVWTPPAPSSEWAPDRLDKGVEIIATESTLHHPTAGFAPLIPLIAKMPEAPRDTGSPLWGMARKPIESLFFWLRKAIARKGDRSLDVIKRDLQHLIGLGPGLTPSGDDLTGGVLIALHALGHETIARTLAEAVLPLARCRTNVISFGHLACAAGGQGGEPVHRILFAMNEQKTEGLVPLLDIMDTVGHSSGWDAVAGLLLAVKAYVGGIKDSSQGITKPVTASGRVEERVCL